MITLPEAKRLKAAGFPWGGLSRDCGGMDDEGEHYGRTDRYLMYATLAAPNSDELIAAIQERWKGFNTMSLSMDNERCCIVYAHGSFMRTEAPTLLSALVDLYCKLAE